LTVAPTRPIFIAPILRPFPLSRLVQVFEPVHSPLHWILFRGNFNIGASESMGECLLWASFRSDANSLA